MNSLQLQLKLPALEVNLVLPGRGVNAIIGPSGAGKTTLLRAVAGLELGARGRIEMNGETWQDDAQNIFIPAHQRSIGFVFQEASLFPHLSVIKNLEFGLRRISKAHQKIALPHVVTLLGIESLLDRSPATLSGGEKQRVSIARALATSPKLLLMDEPLAALDEQRKTEIMPYLERLHQELDIPLLYVSHAIDEVARLADYVVMLEQGRVRASGNTVELLIRPDLPFVCGDQAFSLVTAQTVAYDTYYQLIQMTFSGGKLWLPSSRLIAVGATLRIRIQARDVSLSLEMPTDSSILNSLAVQVTGLHEDTSGLLIVELDANGTKLLARITRKSVDQLGLHVGMNVFAQIKGAAIVG